MALLDRRLWFDPQRANGRLSERKISEDVCIKGRIGPAVKSCVPCDRDEWPGRSKIEVRFGPRNALRSTSGSG